MPTHAEMVEFLLNRKFPGADITRLKVRATRKQDYHTLAEHEPRIPA